MQIENFSCVCVILTADITNFLFQLHIPTMLGLTHSPLFTRLSSELGSGEFGVVRRGVWSVGTEEKEVAVKSLADGSTEEKRIQFLQEAAIMGQFKHPNVITLHGVLLDQEPVRHDANL